MLDFWAGFALSLAAMLGITLICVVWFIIQAANFHDSWLNEKEKKDSSL